MSGALGLLLVAVLIAANGLFVAAEFALVSVRRPSVAELDAAGDRRARAVSRELSRLSFALSSAQFGITLTSLLLGYIAERALGDTLIRPVLDLVGLPEEAEAGAEMLLAGLTGLALTALVDPGFDMRAHALRLLPAGSAGASGPSPHLAYRIHAG